MGGFSATMRRGKMEILGCNRLRRRLASTMRFILISYANLMWVMVLDAAGTLYQVPECNSRAAKLRKAILDRSFDGRLFRDLATRVNGNLRLQPPTTEACQYYAFYFDIVSPDSLP